MLICITATHCIATMLISSSTWLSVGRKICGLGISKQAVRQFSCVPLRKVTEMFQAVERGSLYTSDYRVFFRNEEGTPISPFHDIPMYADASKKTYNMVVEIPRWSNAKMEIATKDPLNPIKQDVKKGNVRFVANCFPHHGYIWNYGAIPQTWENPLHVDPNTECKGDNDPIDIIEIGYRVAKRGEVVAVKVLGCVAMVDEGETDWKIIAIDVQDPIASQVNDIQDVEQFFPGLLKATVEWFKIYKIPDGKPENMFAFNGEAKNKEFALKVIDEVHAFWRDLVCNEVDAGEISKTNVTVEAATDKISAAEAEAILQKSPPLGCQAAVDPIVDKWHYVQLKKE